MKVSIILVNWNAGLLLHNCINAVLSSDSDQYEIILIDNNSTDPDLTAFQENKQITLIRNVINRGFAAACNQGIKASAGEFILILNPDTEIEKDTLTKSVNFLKERGDVAVLGVKHLDRTGKIVPSCSRFVTPLTIFTNALGLPRVFPGIFKPLTVMSDWDHRESAAVDQVMGAFMMIKRDTLPVIQGGMDERFFVYYEDMDLCKRVRASGLVVFYNADISIYHKGMGTTESIKDTRLSYSLTSRMLYIKKYYSFIGYCFALMSTILIEPLSRITLKLMGLNFSGVSEILSGYRLFFKKYFFNG